MAALNCMGIEGREEVQGRSPSGAQWEADVFFSVGSRTVAIELQRSYQHLRELKRRQERYIASAVECYWLVRRETFITLAKTTSRELLKRDFGNVFPAEAAPECCLNYPQQCSVLRASSPGHPHECLKFKQNAASTCHCKIQRTGSCHD